MNLTLRKAHKLRKDIEAALAGRRIALTISLAALNERHASAPAEVVAEARKRTVIDAISEFEKLSGVLTAIRIAIGRANALSGGVDVLLARTADIDRRAKMWKMIEAAETTGDMGVISGKLERARRLADSPEASRYGNADPEVSVSLVDAELHERAASTVMELKRGREALEDERLSSNSRETIEIAEETLTFLREQRII